MKPLLDCKKKKSTLIFWILIILAIIILWITFVTAYSPFKWQLCNAANVTGGECDDYWESFKTEMGIEENTTVSLDEEIKTHIDDEIEVYFQEYYNQSEVDEMISGTNTTHDIKQINKTLNIKFLTLRDNLEEDFVTQREFDKWTDSGSSGIKTSELLIGFVILVIVVVLIVVLGKKKAETSRKEETSSQTVDDRALAKAMKLLKDEHKSKKRK